MGQLLRLKYAYSLLMLDPKTAKHCGFNFVGGYCTGASRFKKVFYELKNMPALLEKAREKTLSFLKNTLCFLDDIIFITRGSKLDSLDVYACLRVLEGKNLKLTVQMSFRLKKLSIASATITPTLVYSH